MNEQRLRQLLSDVKNGRVPVEEAFRALKIMPYEDLDFAKLDHHRAVRDNFPEVIYCAGKSPEQIVAIFSHLSRQHDNLIGTRATQDDFIAVRAAVPDVEFDPGARLLYLQRRPLNGLGKVAVVSAGTADQPVAEEAAVCLEIMGAQIDRIYDVGVAGVHRLLDKLERINQAQVIIVVAGMEGALASVVGGLTNHPVIAVPTSVGYGASFQGLTALLAMLNSCASGVGVVNIDNGYGAAALALAILNTVESSGHRIGD